MHYKNTTQDFIHTHVVNEICYDPVVVPTYQIWYQPNWRTAVHMNYSSLFLAFFMYVLNFLWIEICRQDQYCFFPNQTTSRFAMSHAT